MEKQNKRSTTTLPSFIHHVAGITMANAAHKELKAWQHRHRPFVKQSKTAEKPEGNEPPDLSASYKNTGDKGGHRMTHKAFLSAGAA